MIMMIHFPFIIILLGLISCGNLTTTLESQPADEKPGISAGSDPDDSIAPPQEVTGAHLVSGEALVADSKVPLDSGRVYQFGNVQNSVEIAADGRFEIAISSMIGDDPVLVVVGEQNKESYGSKIDLDPLTEPLDLGQVLNVKTGQLAGAVALDSGSDFSGIDVYLSGTQFIAKTNALGEFFIAGIPAGMWPTLRAEKDGFSPLIHEKILIEESKTTYLGLASLKLDLGVRGTMQIVRTGPIETSAEVTVALDAENASLYQLSEEPNFISSVWEKYLPKMKVKHAFSSSGKKTLYARFSNPNGLESSAVFDTVTVEISPPKILGIQFAPPFLYFSVEEKETEISRFIFSLGINDSPSSLVQNQISVSDRVDLRDFNLSGTEKIYVTVTAENSVGMRSDTKVFPLVENDTKLTVSYSFPTVFLSIDSKNSAVLQRRACISSEAIMACDIMGWVDIFSSSFDIRDYTRLLPLSEGFSSAYLVVQVFDEIGLSVVEITPLDITKPTLAAKVEVEGPQLISMTQLEFVVSDQDNNIREIEFAVTDKADSDDILEWSRLSQSQLNGWFQDGLPLSTVWDTKQSFNEVELLVQQARQLFLPSDHEALFFHARSVNEFGMKSAVASLQLTDKRPRIPQGSVELQKASLLSADDFLTTNGLRFFAVRESCIEYSSCEKFHIVDQILAPGGSLIEAPVGHIEYAILPSDVESPLNSDFAMVSVSARNMLRDPTRASDEPSAYYEVIVPYRLPNISLEEGKDYKLWVRGVGMYGLRSDILSSNVFRYLPTEHFRRLGVEPVSGAVAAPVPYVNYSPASERRFFPSDEKNQLDIFGIARGYVRDRRSGQYPDQHHTLALMKMPDPIDKSIAVFLSYFNPILSSWKPIHKIDTGLELNAIHNRNCHLSNYEYNLTYVGVFCGKYIYTFKILELINKDNPLTGTKDPFVSLRVEKNYGHVNYNSYTSHGVVSLSPGVYLNLYDLEVNVYLTDIESRVDEEFQPSQLGLGEFYFPRKGGDLHLGIISHLKTEDQDLKEFFLNKAVKSFVNDSSALARSDQYHSVGFDVLKMGPGRFRVFVGTSNGFEVIKLTEGIAESTRSINIGDSLPPEAISYGWPSVSKIYALSSSQVIVAHVNPEISSIILRVSNGNSWGLDDPLLGKPVMITTDLIFDFSEGVQFQDSRVGIPEDIVIFGSDYSKVLLRETWLESTFSSSFTRANRFSRLFLIPDVFAPNPIVRRLVADFPLTTPISYLNAFEGELVVADISAQVALDDRCEPGTYRIKNGCFATKPGFYTVEKDSKIPLQCTGTLPPLAVFSGNNTSSQCDFECSQGFLAVDGSECITNTSAALAASVEPYSVICDNDVRCKCPDSVKVLQAGNMFDTEGPSATCNGGYIIKHKDDFPYTRDHIYVDTGGSSIVSTSNWLTAGDRCYWLNEDGHRDQYDWKLPSLGTEGGWQPRHGFDNISLAFSEMFYLWVMNKNYSPSDPMPPLSSQGYSNYFGTPLHGLVGPGGHWSSSASNSTAWVNNEHLFYMHVMDLRTGIVKTQLEKTGSSNYVRCVRGGGSL